MTTETELKEPLREDLERLEAALDTPSVPGEMSGWASMVRKSFDVAARVILSQIESVHPGQLGEIDGQDAELMARTKQMREEDGCHQEWCRRLSGAFAEFEAKTARAGADEKQVVDAQQALLEEGLRFVTHVRKQETAIRSWLQESFARDTGVGD
ncbi:MAG TPA: hypothetical protein VMR25_02835 [Planctomycetaceae bacterium]|jgi:hypothetical protein|nr:hypothetical protein [Planctomycetaceae bacterium]